jgi:N6-adenosine-specific RNA methylase IME4/ParB-like chromosome segregation protein Spo0J
MNLVDIRISKNRLRSVKPNVVSMLTESMSKLGILQPIVVTDDGVLVAGLNRVEAARKMGRKQIAHRTVTLSANEGLLAEIDENLVRAELTPAERAVHIAERKRVYEELHPETKHGATGRRGKRGANLAPFSTDTAAKFERSKRSVERDATRANHIPQIATLIGTSLDQGDELDSLAKLEPEQQASLIERAANGEKVSAKSAAKQAKRAAREKSAAQAIVDENAARTLNDRRFGVVYIDPPWCFETYSEAGKDRAADNHYGTLSIAEISERKPPVAKDAVVLMWTTGPMLAEALQLLRDWGFTYKARLIWRKSNVGTGFWVRVNAEELLIATVGQAIAPAPGTQPRAVIDAEGYEHSRKPIVFAELIERWFPNIPKLEMYARPPFRVGWTVWGNEVPGGMMQVELAEAAE